MQGERAFSARSSANEAPAACRMRRLHVGTAALITLAMSVLSVAAVPAAPIVKVTHAWIRWLPGGAPAGGYAVLTNPGDSSITVLAAASDAYAQVTLHQTHLLNGVSGMVPVAKLVIAAHASVDFVALGYHLMLMRPTRSLKVGDHVRVTLTLADGRSQDADFELRAPTDGMTGDMKDMPGMSH